MHQWFVFCAAVINYFWKYFWVQCQINRRWELSVESNIPSKNTQNTHFVWMDGEVFKAKQAYVGENGEGIKQKYDN